jgi:CubicO group peptidase (beta-lactamase class C family)
VEPKPPPLRIGAAKMKKRLGLIVVTLFAAMSFRALAGTAPDVAIAALPDHLEEHLRAFVATVNAGDAAAVRRFRDADMSEDFAHKVSFGGLLDFFQGQRRVTGGLDFVGARLDPLNPGIVQLAVRDRIYGGAHGARVPFDPGPDHRLSMVETAGTPAWAIADAPALSPDQVAGDVRDMIGRGCKAGVFSGAVLVARGETVMLEQACGEASRRYHVDNKVETRFNLASMNKMFTAVAVMQLVEQGRVSLNDPLSKYADETWLPREISDRITINQLLTHTSGLGDFEIALRKAPRDAYREVDDYKPLVRNEKPSFPPGSDYQYSDTGMLLLGVVIEKASGENYFSYIRRHIYDPAGMTATDSYSLDQPVETLAMGYVPAPDEPHSWRENTLMNLMRGCPAGGGYSTVGDLFRFARALETGKLVSAASLKILWTNHRPNDYGAGFMVEDSAAGKLVGHSGFDLGVSTQYRIYLDKGYVVAVLSNIERGAPILAETISNEIARSH